LLQKRRFAFMVIATAALAALAAGIVVGRHSGNALAQGPPRVLAQGQFRSLTWNTNGTASLVREPSGDLQLRLSHDFMTKAAPELYVYLTKLRGQQRVYWKLVGALKRSQGPQQYSLSAKAGSISGLQVAIYCAKCNQISGLAALTAIPSRQ
jgi:hypothetical protein